MQNKSLAIIAALSALSSAIVLPSTANAASIGYYAITNIAGPTCDGTVTLSTAAASAYCDTDDVGTTTGTNTVVLESRADPGTIGTRTHLFGIGPMSAGPLTARAGIRDNLNFGVSTGFLELSLDIAGGSNFGSLGLGNSRSTVSISVSGSGSGGNVFARDERLLSTDGIIETLSATGNLGITTVNLAFTGGSLYLSADMTNEINCFVALLGDPCAIGADYFNSLRLVGARVFDSGGSESFAPIVSELGFDYRTGVEAHDAPPTPAVPLPAAGWMLIGGLSALFAIRRRRHHAPT